MTREDAPRVLVVEDAQAVADTLAYVLEDEGYRVATGAPARAVELARADPPELVLLDVTMPPVDGVDVCRELRADPRTRDVPIVFVTVVPEVEVRRRLDGCRYDAFLTKPCDVDTLVDTVARLCPSPSGRP